MSARSRIVVAVCAVTAATAALTGCQADDSGESSAPLVVPAATMSADTTADPFPSMTAGGLLNLAESDMRGSGAMTVSLNGLEEGMKLQVKSAISTSGKCAAAARVNDVTIQLITVDSRTYLKADADFWRATGGSKGDKVATAAAGRWVKLTEEVLDRGNLRDFCSFDDLMDGLLVGGDDENGLVKGEPTTLDGKLVVPLTVKLSAETDTIYVSTGKTPYVVKVESSDGDTPAVGTFGHFGEMPKVSAPPASQTVDFDSLGIDPGQDGLHV